MVRFASGLFWKWVLVIKNRMPLLDFRLHWMMSGRTVDNKCNCQKQILTIKKFFNRHLSHHSILCNMKPKTGLPLHTEKISNQIFLSETYEKLPVISVYNI